MGYIVLTIFFVICQAVTIAYHVIKTNEIIEQGGRPALPRGHHEHLWDVWETVADGPDGETIRRVCLTCNLPEVRTIGGPAARPDLPTPQEDGYSNAPKPDENTDPEPDHDWSEHIARKARAAERASLFTPDVTVNVQTYGGRPRTLTESDIGNEALHYLTDRAAAGDKIALANLRARGLLK